VTFSISGIFPVRWLRPVALVYLSPLSAVVGA